MCYFITKEREARSNTCTPVGKEKFTMDADNADRRNVIVREAVSLGAATVGGAVVYVTVHKHYPAVVEWAGRILVAWLKNPAPNGNSPK